MITTLAEKKKLRMVKGVTMRPKGVRADCVYRADMPPVKRRGEIWKVRGRRIRGAAVFEEVELTAATTIDT